MDVCPRHDAPDAAAAECCNVPGGVESRLDAIMELEQARVLLYILVPRQRQPFTCLAVTRAQLGFKQTETRDTFRERVLAFSDGVIVEPLVGDTARCLCRSTLLMLRAADRLHHL